MAELLTRAEYARRVGKSKQYIGRMVKVGRISLVNNLIDPETTDKVLSMCALPTWTPTATIEKPSRNPGKPPKKRTPATLSVGKAGALTTWATVSSGLVGLSERIAGQVSGTMDQAEIRNLVFREFEIFSKGLSDHLQK
ncbi:MAG: hypothetical protein HQL72_12190 [Magnetococcales bacterium]|nr:hypothetical protein [Magnetococcales bacterium]